MIMDWVSLDPTPESMGAELEIDTMDIFARLFQETQEATENFGEHFYRLQCGIRLGATPANLESWPIAPIPDSYDWSLGCSLVGRRYSCL